VIGDGAQEKSVITAFRSPVGQSLSPVKGVRSIVLSKEKGQQQHGGKGGREKEARKREEEKREADRLPMEKDEKEKDYKNCYGRRAKEKKEGKVKESEGHKHHNSRREKQQTSLKGEN